MQAKQVFGIGNPLLDMSVNVTEEFLEKYGIKKANASMATEKELPLFDEIKTDPNIKYLAGGATQNSIRGAAWMLSHSGKSKLCYMTGSISRDENGALLVKAAEEAGVVPNFYYSSKHGTGRCAVLIVNKERSLVADLAAANDYDHAHFESPETQAIVSASEIFYTASFFLTVSPQTSVAIGKHCLEHNKTFIINISATFLVDYFWDKLCDVVKYADIVVGNEDEAASFAKKSGWPENDLEGAALKLSQLPKEGTRSRTVIFTHGSEPTIIAHDGVVTLKPVVPVDKSLIVDTNGAGDAFVAGLIAGLSLGHGIEKSVAAGQYVAGQVIQLDGPTYPKECTFSWA
jgi:adenosine kinase